MEPSDDGVAGDSPEVVEAVEERVARTVMIDPVESPVTAPVRESAPGVIGIYECRQDGQKILSDRPCGPDAVERLIDTRELNTFTETRQVTVGGAPSAAPAIRSPRPAAAVGSGPRTAADKAGLCQTLQARIDAINARTRQKHTHREGEYWRAKWHEAKNAYYDAGCGRPYSKQTQRHILSGYPAGSGFQTVLTVGAERTEGGSEVRRSGSIPSICHNIHYAKL